MNKLVGTALIIAIVSSGALAENDWKKQLAGPLVVVSGGKLIYEEVELCTVPATSPAGQSFTLQVKTHSEAPADTFISRDNFVAVTAITSYEWTQQLGDYNCKTLEGLIGRPDLEIAIHMTKEGVQISVNDTRTAQKTTTTTRWQDMFEQ